MNGFCLLVNDGNAPSYGGGNISNSGAGFSPETREGVMYGNGNQ
jgi:hypothetical protein